MGTLSALGPFLDLAVSILNMIATAEAMKYVSQLNDARMQLEAEIQKGYQSDDAKIESLYAQIQTLGQTVQNELAVYQGKGPSAVPPSSPGVAGASSGAPVS